MQTTVKLPKLPQPATQPYDTEGRQLIAAATDEDFAQFINDSLSYIANLRLMQFWKTLSFITHDENITIEKILANHDLRIKFINNLIAMSGGSNEGDLSAEIGMYEFKYNRRTQK